MMNRINLMHLTLAVILHASIFTYSEKLWTDPPMSYVEEDNFFDRVVFPILNIKNLDGYKTLQKIISSGVLISENRLLTSYNPFRNSLNVEPILSKIVICYLKRRNPSSSKSYDYDCEKVKFGRPVIPLDDKNDQWYSPDMKHSPMHDLMILRLENPLKLRPEDNKNNALTGPSKTELATEKDKIDKFIKFVALGLKTAENAKKFSKLDYVNYSSVDYEEFVIDCDSWLPRSWGYFICIKNEFCEGFGSGALLFSKDKLFGVGSFTLQREKESILVFTDVRPYNTLIKNTCTDSDLNLKTM